MRTKESDKHRTNENADDDGEKKGGVEERRGIYAKKGVKRGPRREKRGEKKN